MKHFPTSKAINIQGDTSRWALGSVAINLGSSPACGPLLQLATAQGGQGNSPNWLQQNLGLDVMCHPVLRNRRHHFRWQRVWNDLFKDEHKAKAASQNVVPVTSLPRATQTDSRRLVLCFLSVTSWPRKTHTCRRAGDGRVREENAHHFVSLMTPERQNQDWKMVELCRIEHWPRFVNYKV